MSEKTMRDSQLQAACLARSPVRRCLNGIRQSAVVTAPRIPTEKREEERLRLGNVGAAASYFNGAAA